MSDTEPEIAEAKPHRRRFSWIWLIPIGAALVAAYLGYSTFSTRGPLITVDFSTADGLTAGQTQVQFKSVNVGMVESIRLTEDLSRVAVRVRMQRDMENRLTANARFWVVRPRLTAGSISGLETIVSGAFIEFDPGEPGAERQSEFEGLDDPPGIRPGEPGRVVIIKSRRLGPLERGSVVFFRDVAVGEVLSYEPPPLDGEVSLRVFIRAPYSEYLRRGSRFWNTSGITFGFGPSGLKVEVASLRAALAGGISFDTPPELRDAPPAPEDTTYQLYDNLEAAISATSAERLEFLTYLDGSASGLAAGSPVEMRGIRIGSVLKVELAYDRTSGLFTVPVHIAIEPRNIAFPNGRPQEEVMTAVKRMVAEGFRVQLRSGNLLTGQKVLSFDQIQNAPPAEVTMEDGTIVLPGTGGDSADIMAAVGAVAGKLERFPLDEIGSNLNADLASINGVVGGPELKDALGSLSGALGQVQELVRKADDGATPLLRRLPEIASNLDQAVRRASSAVGSIERGYGGDSSFNRQLDRTLQQVNDAARSIRLLADFLDRHPEALIRGRD